MRNKMKAIAFGNGVVNVMGAKRNDIEIYLKEIRHFQGLTEDDELDLATKIQNGDRKAEEKMIKANLRLVVTLANCYGTIMPLEDLIQNGNIGLIYAVRKFDPAKGLRFVTLATWMIRKYILLGIINESRVVRRPMDEQTELSTAESLDEPAYGEDDDIAKSDLLVGDIWVNNDLDSLATDLARVMKATLDERAITIVCKVMGIGEQPMFMDSIAKELNIGKERVRQIFQESLATLRKDARAPKLLANYRG